MESNKILRTQCYMCLGQWRKILLESILLFKILSSFPSALTSLRFQLLLDSCSVSGDFFSRRMLQPTVSARLLHYWQQRQLTSSVYWSGHQTQTTRISIWWTLRFGGFCRSDSTIVRSATLTIWKKDWRVASLWSEHHWAVNQWRDRLRKWIRAKWRHFEHMI